MGYHELSDESRARLHELADLQHPHLAGDNHTRTLINKVFDKKKITTQEAFDCGKYYQRMLEQLRKLEGNENYEGYLHAVLAFKWNV